MALCTGNTWKSFPTARYGSTGSGIFLIQNILVELSDFGIISWGQGSPTGTYDHYTEYGIKQYQRKNGLADDGICGPNTWYALMRGTNTEIYNQWSYSMDGLKYYYRRRVFSSDRTKSKYSPAYRGVDNLVWYDGSAVRPYEVN